jgi:hypothetical protein
MVDNTGKYSGRAVELPEKQVIAVDETTMNPEFLPGRFPPLNTIGESEINASFVDQTKQREAHLASHRLTSHRRGTVLGEPKFTDNIKTADLFGRKAKGFFF